jgi:iron complex outermembrane receptor protein
MGYRIRPLVTAMAVAFSSMAVWQNASAQTTTVLDDVVVRAAKEQPLPGANSLGERQIAPLRAATSDTASLLQDVPGVSLYGAGGTSSLPSIHGLADDRLRIKVDGMDLIASCPNHMNPALSYLDPSNVGTLKVYAGITPVSVGGDSIGGTIIAETKAPEFAAPGQGLLTKGEIGTFYRSNNDARGANLSATLASEQLSVTYTGATAKANNYDAGGNFKTSTVTGRAGHALPLNEVGSSAYETRTHTLGFAMRGTGHLLEARLGYQEVPQQLYPNQRMDMLDNEQKRINLRYLGDYDWGRFEVRAYHEQVDHYMNFGPDKQLAYGTAVNGMPMYSAGKTTGLSAKGDIMVNEQDLLRMGADYQRYTLNDWWPASGTGSMGPGTFENINDGQRDRAALFAEWERKLTPQWTSLIGLRYERVTSDAGDVRGYNMTAMGMGNQKRDADAFNAQAHQRTDNNWDLTTLARYTHNANYDIEFGFARKVRSPNLYERYTWSSWSMAALMNNFVGDGNGYIGNIDLAPEKAHTLSATFDSHATDRSWEFKATPFYTRVTDYIDAIQWNAATNAPRTSAVEDSFTVLRYTNHSARLYGLDLSGRMPLAKTGVGQFGLKGLLNYTNGKNRDTGGHLYNIMPLNAKLIVTQQLGAWDNAIEWVGAKGKQDVSAVRNEIKTAGYGLLNLRASYSWNTVRVDFGVENLFDKFYSLPLGGAYVGQGTTMSATGTPYGIAVPGMGRSLYAGVNVKF